MTRENQNSNSQLHHFKCENIRDETVRKFRSYFVLFYSKYADKMNQLPNVTAKCMRCPSSCFKTNAMLLSCKLLVITCNKMQKEIQNAQARKNRFKTCNIMVICNTKYRKNISNKMFLTTKLKKKVNQRFC